ncbi:MULTISPECIES: class I SAM-dependent methyltransferase [unclassified Mycobacterium]|uniref:class I SAM-dependent methyltransferase n=1 Tax=unclassified Mycobacterium TaxID=2642494 RepID=UPI0029C721AA|nr:MULTISPECIES: class I SAM-dependent methyltransferase [unclassified Mycobacterium]
MTSSRGRFADGVAPAFDKFARFYDMPWLQSCVYRPPQDAIVAELRARGARRIVDVGCGTGILADRIQRELRPDEVVGVDASAGMLEKAKARSATVRWIVGTAEDLPLPDGSVDAVVTTTAFHFFDQPAALAEFRRVLAPGGIAAVGVVTQPFAMPGPLGRIGEGWVNRLHQPTAEELRNLFGEAGFQRVEQRGVGSGPFSWPFFYRITIGASP